MTIERLEEIAAWAEKNVEWCHIQELAETRVYFSDLARCARAWAKVEKLKPIGKWRASRTTGYFTLSSGVMQGSGTAIEAVEAAGGGK